MCYSPIHRLCDKPRENHFIHLSISAMVKWLIYIANLFQVNLADVSLGEVTFVEGDDDMKKFKSAFLLFCQGNRVSLTYSAFRWWVWERRGLT